MDELDSMASFIPNCFSQFRRMDRHQPFVT